MSHLPLLLPLVLAVVLILGTAGFIALCYRRIGPHQALVVNGPKGLRVFLGGGAVVLPLHRAEVMDLSTHALVLTLTGAQSLQCKNCLRADVRARFLLRANPTAEDVEKVARTVGAQRASSPEALRELFEAKFRESLRLVCQSFDFEDWLTHQEEVRDQVIRVIGRDLNGFVLDDLQLEELSATPLSFYDSTNILDAQGIRRIVEVTTQQQLARNEAEQRARVEELRMRAAADEEAFRLEREKAEREAKRMGEALPAHRARVEAEVSSRAAEVEAAFRRGLEGPQAEGRASGEGGTTEGDSGAGLQAGLRKT